MRIIHIIIVYIAVVIRYVSIADRTHIGVGFFTDFIDGILLSITEINTYITSTRIIDKRMNFCVACNKCAKTSFSVRL